MLKKDLFSRKHVCWAETSNAHRILLMKKRRDLWFTHVIKERQIEYRAECRGLSKHRPWHPRHRPGEYHLKRDRKNSSKWRKKMISSLKTQQTQWNKPNITKIRLSKDSTREYLCLELQGYLQEPLPFQEGHHSRKRHYRCFTQYPRKTRCSSKNCDEGRADYTIRLVFTETLLPEVDKIGLIIHDQIWARRTIRARVPDLSFQLQPIQWWFVCPGHHGPWGPWRVVPQTRSGSRSRRSVGLHRMAEHTRHWVEWWAFSPFSSFSFQGFRWSRILREIVFYSCCTMIRAPSSLSGPEKLLSKKSVCSSGLHFPKGKPQLQKSLKTIKPRDVIEGLNNAASQKNCIKNQKKEKGTLSNPRSSVSGSEKCALRQKLAWNTKRF